MIHKINSLFFCLALLLSCYFFWIWHLHPLAKKHTEQMIETEKRIPSSFPVWSIDSYFRKDRNPDDSIQLNSYMDSVSLYVDDHMPFRKQLVEFAQNLRSLRGYRIKDGEKVVKTRKREKVKNVLVDPSKSELQFVENFNAEYSGSLLILNGKVYNLTGGSTAMSPVFSRMVSEYASQLKGHTRVFSAVAPVSCAFIPAEKYRSYNSQNKRTLAAIGASLSNGAIFADVFAELNNHAGKQLYFGTDHHWNALGAYYAYVAFCKSAGMSAVPLENMSRKVKYGFLGSMYQETLDPDVKARPDTFEYFIPPVLTQAVYFSESTLTAPKKCSVFANSSGGNMYSTFISGDHPLTKITTSTKNGRKCAVVKNSMGNAFSVYLISHYEEIWVFDYRYSKHNLTQIIRDNHINDLIFAVGLYGAMSKGTINMMRNLGDGTKVILPDFPNQSLDSIPQSAVLPASQNTKRKDTLNEK